MNLSTKRRWFAYSLRTMFVVVTSVGVVSAVAVPSFKAYLQSRQDRLKAQTEIDLLVQRARAAFKSIEDNPIICDFDFEPQLQAPAQGH